MSQTSRTSTNEHLQAIHAECSGFVDGEPPDLEVIIQHAEALAARVERLQEALRVAAALADMRGKQISPYYPSVLCGQGQSELGLQPGDMPDLPNNDGSNGR